MEKLQLSSTPQSLMQWGESVSESMMSGNTLLSVNAVLSSSIDGAFVQKAELIVMGKTFSNVQLHALLLLLSDKGVEQVKLCSPQEIEGVSCIRLVLSRYPSDLKSALDIFVKDNVLDFALMEQFPDWSQAGIVLMDMDSTTIQIECIDEIARLYGVGEQVSEVTALAMQGKLDFNESLRTRVSKLENMPVSILKEVADNMPLMPGLTVLIASLKNAGWKVAIASGGFTYFADSLKQNHGFDYTIANTLEIVDDKLTGNVVGEIINADIKARTLKELAEKYDIPMSQTVAIGDGANDLVMMAASAMGIAIHAKPIVQKTAAVSLNNLDLEGALAILSLGR